MQKPSILMAPKAQPGAAQPVTHMSKDERAFVPPPALLALAKRVAALNRDAGEIGAGMLASLVDDARAALAQTACLTCSGRGSYRQPYARFATACPDCSARPRTAKALAEVQARGKA